VKRQKVPIGQTVQGVISNERQRALNQLESALETQAFDPKLGDGQKGLKGAGIIGRHIMFGLKRLIAILEPLCSFHEQAVACARSQGLAYHLAHHGKVG
jgi:hypothetical protein